MTPAIPLLGGAAILLLLLLGSGSAMAADSPRRARNNTPQPAWKRRVLERVSGHEGGYGSQNRNWDGAGLSYGILQWTQKHGNLGILLTRLHAVDSATFRRIFGSEAATLLAITTADTKAERLSLALWSPPWTARFTAAGKHAPFQQAQLRLALSGDHWRGAERVAASFGSAGLITERSMALFFDTSVQQGPGAAMRFAKTVRGALTARGAVTVNYFDVLELYAQTAANDARRIQATKPTSRGTWREVSPGEWHKVIGAKFDFYNDFHKRRFGIVRDASLSDAPIATFA